MSITVVPDVALLVAEDDGACFDIVLPGPERCWHGMPHSWQEVARYQLYTASSTSALPPYDCPITVQEQCVACSMTRTRDQPLERTKP